MTGTLEQVYFTWVAQGPEGQRGFQIVAASPALREPTHRCRSTALTLCRYTLPRGVRDPAEAPISYGYVDNAGYRYVFHKVYLGSDAFGRPGNFAAHVLVGAKHDLPATSLPALLGSPWWWRGEPEEAWQDGHLPTVELSAIPPGPARSPNTDPRALAEAIFTAGGRRAVAVDSTPLEVRDLVAGLAEHAPQLVEYIAFSTYEPADPPVSFSVVGTARPGDTPPGALLLGTHPPSAEAQEAAAVVLSGTTHATTVMRIAYSVATSETGTLDMTALVQSTRGFDLLLRGGDVDRALLRVALGSRAGVAALLSNDHGIEALSGAITANNAVDMSAVRDACVTDDAMARRLSEAIAHNITGWGTASSALRSARSISDQFHRYLCLSLCRHAATFSVNDLNVATAVDILRATEAAQSHVDPAVLDRLATVAATDLRGILRGNDLGKNALGPVLAKALAHPEADFRALAELFATSPAFAGYAAPHLRDPRPLTQLLRHCDRASVTAIARAALRTLDAAAFYGFLSPYVEEIDLDRQLPLLAACTSGDGRRPDPRWGSVIRQALRETTELAMSTIEPYRPPTDQVLALLARIPGGPIGEVLLRDNRRVLNSTVLAEFRSTSEFLVAAELTVTLLFQSQSNANELSTAAELLHSIWLPREEWLLPFLRAAHRAKRRNPAAARIAAHYVISSIGSRFGSGRRDIPKPTHNLARKLVADCAPGELEILDAKAELGGADALKWWRSVRPKPGLVTRVRSLWQ